MFIFCRNIGLSILNILSVFNDKQNQKESFLCSLYLGKVSVTSARQKMKEIKLYNSHLTSGCIKTRDDICTLMILVETSLNCAHCHKISKRWHHFRTDGIRSKQVSVSSQGEKIATSDVRAEQRTVIQFCFESGMTPLDTLN